MLRQVGILLLFTGLFLHPVSTSAQLNRQKPENLQDVGISERLGEKIPLDLTFATSSGDSVKLADLIQNGKPVLLNPVYYNCPMLCTMVIDAVLEGVKDVEWSPGKEYTIITYSIDPTEDHKLAATTKDSIISRLGRKDAGKGWYFLTGKEEAIQTLSEAVGFKFQKLDHTNEFAHSASIMFISPDGVITRYLYGINFTESNIRNALYEAADGNIGSTVDRLILYCYQYDPDSQSYVPVAWRIMKLGGVVTLVFLGIFLGLFWYKEKNSKNDKKTDIANGNF
jgi:protein SCO1/2